MFDSKISADIIIDEIEKETDIAVIIPRNTYFEWINSIEQLLYGAIIREMREKTVNIPDDGILKLSEIEVSDGEDEVRFEDIYAVYAGGVQLVKSTLASGVIFPDCYYKKNNNLAVNCDKHDGVRLVYFARPELKEPDNSGNIMVPPEFIELVKSKLRGEAYKLANENNLSAKWLNDYNAHIEDFKAWIDEKRPQFGV